MIEPREVEKGPYALVPDPDTGRTRINVPFWTDPDRVQWRRSTIARVRHRSGVEVIIKEFDAEVIGYESAAEVA